MKAAVAYESFWGNTAAAARAIAARLGAAARAMDTGEAPPEALAGVDLIAAGSPVIGFKLPTERMREAIRADPGTAPAPPDRSQTSMASCLQGLPVGCAAVAAFDTRGRGAFGSAAPAILKAWRRPGTGGSPSPGASSSPASTARSGKASWSGPGSGARNWPVSRAEEQTEGAR